MSVDYVVSNFLAGQAGQLYSFVGTSVTSSAASAVAYSGLGLFNPAGSGMKITLLKAGYGHVGAVAGTSNPICWAKVTGTATFGVLTASNAGVITSPGIFGTTTGVGVVFGTGTLLNGTVIPNVHALNPQSLIGGIGTAGNSNPNSTEFAGESTLMPGEYGALWANVAVTGIPFLSWYEQPIK